MNFPEANPTMPHGLIPVTSQPGLPLPALFALDAGTARRVSEFFTANIRNRHSRKASAKVAAEFAA
jgi:hypothetical protein